MLPRTPRAQRSRQVLNAEGSRRSTINTLITTKKQRVRSNTQTFILIGVIATLALSGCTESQKESYVAPASTLTEAPPFMDAVVQELIGYVPPGHIDDSRYDPDDDQTSTAMFCSSDLDGVSDYITIMRSASLWTDSTVDLVEVTKQIEADYSAKPGWSVTRPKEGYSGPEITVHSPERYMFNIGIRPDSNYFSIGGWSPCFPKPPEHSGIDKY